MFHKLMFAVALKWAWFARLVSKQLTNDEMQTIYAREGSNFGSVVSHLAMGECIGFREMFESWAFWEREYTRRGFVTLSVDAFVDAGGWGHSLDGLLGKWRLVNEYPIYHAERYREHFLGKMPKGILEGGFGGLVDENGTPRIIVAQYPIPSTEDPPEGT